MISLDSTAGSYTLHLGPRRKRSGAAIDKVAKANEMRRNRTRSEEKLFRALLSARLSKKISREFKTQHRLAGYIADVIFPDARLVVEADGGVHDEQSIEDAIRDVAMARRGYLTIRFTNEEIDSNVAAVVFEIGRILDGTERHGPSLSAVEECAKSLRPTFPIGAPTQVSVTLDRARADIESKAANDSVATWQERENLRQAQSAYDRAWWYPWSRKKILRRIEAVERATSARIDTVYQWRERTLRELESPLFQQKLELEYAQHRRRHDEYVSKNAAYKAAQGQFESLKRGLDLLESDLTTCKGMVLPARGRCNSIAELLLETRRACNALLKKPST